LNAWDGNINALRSWGYLDESFANDLAELYQDVGCRYLHSEAIGDIAADALRGAGMAYKLLEKFLGFPRDLFTFTNSIECRDTSDPRFLAFYKSHICDNP